MRPILTPTECGAFSVTDESVRHYVHRPLRCATRARRIRVRSSSRNAELHPPFRAADPRRAARSPVSRRRRLIDDAENAFALKASRLTAISAPAIKPFFRRAGQPSTRGRAQASVGSGDFFRKNPQLGNAAATATINHWRPVGCDGLSI